MEYIKFSNTESILIYICIVLSTTFMMHQANRYQDSAKGMRYVFAAICIAAVPAAMRFYVGIDYASFYEIGNHVGQLNSIKSAISYKAHIESSYSIAAYFLYKVFGSSVYVIGLYAVLTQIFMLCGAWEYKRYSKPEATTFFYMCSFYWRTLNIFRQALAVSIIFWAVHFLLKKKTFPFIIATIAATWIHSSAIVSLLLIVYFRNSSKNSLLSGIELLIPVFCAIAMGSLYKVAAQIPLLARYIVVYSDAKRQSFFTPGTLLELTVLGTYTLYRVKTKNTVSRCSEILNVFDKAMVCSTIFYFLTFQIKYAARIGLYFTVFAYCAYGLICGERFVQYRRLKLTIFQIGFILISSAYFISTMASNGYGQLPYRFWVP